ncbi:unnamed protein product [Caenorhabditis brenneri]
MYNNFLSIENPNPLMPNMPFMMPPIGIAPWMMPGMPGLVPMINPGQMPTNYQDYILPRHSETIPCQSFLPTPPGIPVPTDPTPRMAAPSSVFHSLVVKKLLQYIEEKAKKDSVKVEIIDLVSDEEEEEEIDVVGSPRIENSLIDVISPQDSGRYSGESDAPQTDGEKPEEESMEDEFMEDMENEFIVVNSFKSPVVSFEKSLEEPSILDSDPPLISEATTVKQQKFSVGKQKRRKYSKFFFLFTTAQIEYLENMFSRNGTIKPKVVKCLADGNELAEKQIKKWLKHRRHMRYRTNVRERKRMENMSGSMMDIEELWRR